MTSSPGQDKAKAAVDARGSKGAQVGDHGTQINQFIQTYVESRVIYGPPGPGSRPGTTGPSSLVKKVTGHGRRKLLYKEVYSVAFSPDGRLIASGGDDKTVLVQEVATGAPVREFTVDAKFHEVWAVAFSPDGNLIAGGDNDGKVWLWEMTTWRERHFARHISWVTDVAFSPDGRLLASVGRDGTMSLLDVATGEEVRKFEPLHGSMLGVAFSPDGKLLATAGYDLRVRLWEVSTGSEVQVLWGHILTKYSRIRKAGTGLGVSDVAFSPDGKLLASAGSDAVVCLWEVSTGEGVHRLVGHTDEVEAVAFSPDGKLLASGARDKMVRLWEVSTGSPVRALKGHTSWVRDVAFSPDGMLASCGNDNTVRFWM